MAMQLVQTEFGQILGVDRGAYTVFKGVPYAKPPVGELRFMPPEDPEKWDGVLEAKAFGHSCWQNRWEGGSFYEKEFYSTEDRQPQCDEDCLYLNIWTPAHAVDEKLPVAFWIHGGAFDHGFGNEAEFDGAALCSRGVILVTINYRVGAFGFLAHPWLTKRNSNKTTANNGILDQIKAMTWVYNNIGFFGGDKNNITVFGQSAGAMSTRTLISSPLTDGMIAKTILQSGAGYPSGLSRDCTPAQAEATGIEIVKYCGAESLEELLAMPAEELKTGSLAYQRESRRGLIFTPVIDGSLLVDGYDASLEKGIVKDIPTMIGATLNDIAVTEEMLLRGERGFLYEGCKNWSFLLEKIGRKPAYVYDFIRRLPGDDAGAFHTAEVWYTFGTLDRCWRPLLKADYALSERMTDCWAEFMKSGIPSETWRPCSEKDPYIQVFDIE